MPQTQQLTIKQALSRAKKATQKGNVDVALQLYNAVLQNQPSHPVAKKGLRKLQKGLPRNQSVQTQSTNPSQDQMNALINLYNSGQLKEAEQACKKLLQTYPQSLIVYNVLGAAFQGQGKLQNAVQAFDKAIQFMPDYVEAHSNRGVALRDLGQLEEAVRSYDKAIQFKPDYVEAHSNRGVALRALGQLEEAVRSYDKAIQFKPDYAEAYRNRGTALSDLGQLEEAVRSYDKAIQFKPDYAEAHYNLSSLKKYESNDAQIGVMESLFTNIECRESDRMHLCFALAKAYEDLGEYDKSFNYLKEGNYLRKKELKYNIDNDRRLVTKIIGLFSTGSLPFDVSPEGSSSIQPVFIVGMPRSGTSLVEQILASHTKVYGAGELETINKLVIPILSNLPDQNINKNGDKLSQNAIQTLHDSYIKVLSALKVPEKIITDKMPLNFRFLGFILSAFPEAKIINLNRDPRATCWSIYKHYFSSKGNEYAYDIVDLVEFHKIYIDMMSFWRQRFPYNIYDLCYEDLTENQEEETRSLLMFCDLEWEERCLNFHKTKRVVKTASAVQVRKKLYKGSSEAWRKYEKHLQPLIKALGY